MADEEEDQGFWDYDESNKEKPLVCRKCGEHLAMDECVDHAEKHQKKRK